MILIVLLVIIFAVVALFLFSLAKTVSQEDYMDLYVNNLMLSIMKTDTGYTDSHCKLISDATACAFATYNWPCGKSGMFDLVDYIHQQKDLGKTDTQIRNSLLDQGWYQEEIDEAFSIASGSSEPDSITCLDLANTSLSRFMDKFEKISKNYRYLFVVHSDVCSKVDEGCRVIHFGDDTLEDYKGNKKTARYVIQKSLSGTRMNLIVRLYFARK